MALSNKNKSKKQTKIGLREFVNNEKFDFIKKFASMSNNLYSIFDEKGKIIFGEMKYSKKAAPIYIDGLLYGWILSKGPLSPFIEMIRYIIYSELVKKSLASEILLNYKELNAISEINSNISLNLRDYRSIGGTALSEIMKIIPSDFGSIKFFNNATLEFEIIAAVGDYYKNKLNEKLSDGLSGSVFFGGKPEIINNVESDVRFSRKIGIKSMICIPLMVCGNAIGVAEIGSLTKDVNYGSSEILILNNIVMNTSLLIELSKLYDTERRLVDELEGEREEKKLFKNLSAIDPLTGLYNRRKTLALFSQLLYIAKKRSKDLSVTLLDIDDFKKINDTVGHGTGDNVLKNIAVKISCCLRKDVVLGRYGGDEFIIISLGTGEASTISMLERVKDSLGRFDFLNNGSVTCSFGVACHENEDNMESLIDKADMALYEAKNGGKNRIGVWNKSLARIYH